MIAGCREAADVARVTTDEVYERNPTAKSIILPEARHKAGKSTAQA